MRIRMHGPRSSKGPQGATPRTRSAGTTTTWTAGLNWMDYPPHAAEDFSTCNHLTCKQAVALLE